MMHPVMFSLQNSQEYDNILNVVILTSWKWWRLIGWWEIMPRLANNNCDRHFTNKGIAMYLHSWMFCHENMAVFLGEKKHSWFW
jgi:hypothetical protein